MHTRPTPSLTTFALALLLVTPAAFAQPGPGASPPAARPGPAGFAMFDRDGDGVVTEQEFNTVRAERMAARAAQGAPMRNAANAPTFNDFDLNGDGRLTAEEFNQARGQWRNRPGAGMAPGPGDGPGPGWGSGYGPGGGMGPGYGPDMGPGRGRGMQMPAFSDFDGNGDGVLTEQEFYDARAARMRQRAMQGYQMRNAPNAPTFQQLDTDGDGKLSPAEFAAAQVAHARPRGPATPAPGNPQ